MAPIPSLGHDSASLVDPRTRGAVARDYVLYDLNRFVWVVQAKVFRPVAAALAVAFEFVP